VAPTPGLRQSTMTKLLPLLLLATALTAVSATKCRLGDFQCVSPTAFCHGGQVTACAAGTKCVTQANDRSSPCVTSTSPGNPASKLCRNKPNGVCLTSTILCSGGLPLTCARGQKCLKGSCVPVKPQPNPDPSTLCPSTAPRQCLTDSLYCARGRVVRCAAGTSCVEGWCVPDHEPEPEPEPTNPCDDLPLGANVCLSPLLYCRNGVLRACRPTTMCMDGRCIEH